MNSLETAKNDVREIILNALGILVGTGVIPPKPLPCFDVMLNHGHLCSNAALISSKTLGIAPELLSVMIAEASDMYGTCISEVSLSQNGFINFKTKDCIFAKDYFNLNIPSRNDKICIAIQAENNSISQLKTEIYAEALKNLYEYCGNQVDILTADDITSCNENAKKHLVGIECNVSPKTSDIFIPLARTRFTKAGMPVSLTHNGNPLSADNIQDEIPLDYLRFFLLTNVAVLDFDKMYEETTENPFFSIQKACSLCKKTLSNKNSMRELDDTSRFLCLKACSVKDVIAHCAYSHSLKPLCDAIKNLAQDFNEYYYQKHSACETSAYYVYNAIITTLKILGIKNTDRI